MKKLSTDWELLGEVGVDSGQLMITDPCYIDSFWKIGTSPRGHPELELTAKGMKKFPSLVLRSLNKWKWGRDFSNYEQILPEINMTMNKAIKGKFFAEVKVSTSKQYSYRGACDTSLEGGSLKFPTGIDGSGVVFRSGYGDGLYPVYGRRNEEGRIVEVKIVMG